MTTLSNNSKLQQTIITLNQPQQEAVLYNEGPLLVLAGAGTGKTRVLTTKIAHLIEQCYIYPSAILAVTFTNKAAKEMMSRVEQYINAKGIWLGTFHSVAARILRQHATHFGLSNDFTIIDTADQQRLIKNIISDYGFDDKRYIVKQIAYYISYWKDCCWWPDQVPASNSAGFTEALTIYPIYQQRLRQNNGVDFADLLMLNLKLFTDDATVLAQYQQKFNYVLVDEYQDTNQSQLKWLQLLAANHQNICCVGDDDQSIYGWRGAEVANIVNFAKYYPGAKIIRLEQNYRSTSHILKAASAIISNNQQRLGKELWCQQAEGNKITQFVANTDLEEAALLCRQINSLHAEGQADYKDCAVLVRTSAQTRVLEERLVTDGIPYQVIGGLKFYDRAEIKDVLAYLRLAVSLHDDLAFERVVNVPKRGVGKVTINNIRTRALQSDTSMVKATKEMLDSGLIKGKTSAVLTHFIQQLSNWHILINKQNIDEVVKTILDDSGYLQMWQQQNDLESKGRLENINELYRAISNFESITEFLQHISLVTDTDNVRDEDLVSVMTLHAAKGLEFKVVFLPGWEEGLFPHQRSLDETGLKALEEERRLAYVGITRARERLFISYAKQRRLFKNIQQQMPSRFWAELPKACCQQLNHLRVSRPSLAVHHYQPSTQDLASDNDCASAFHQGAVVFHQKFGSGVVLKVDGQFLEIAFKNAGTKKVVDSFVELCG
ncbi:MAG: UvrD-helicase domain-containing protein [Pseudomonadota bacterium]